MKKLLLLLLLSFNFFFFQIKDEAELRKVMGDFTIDLAKYYPQSSLNERTKK